MKNEKPFYYRQRLLLAFIAAHQDGINKTDIQKKLFLFLQSQQQLIYEFIPYRYGCYSWQCDMDTKRLVKDRWLTQHDERYIATSTNTADMLTASHRTSLRNFLATAPAKKSGNQLIRYVYRKFPYYAINSEIANEILAPNDRKAVQKARPKSTATTLFTIGYEGLTFENYTNTLIKNDVRVLCDLRANPLSRKPGLSKGALSNLLPNVGIEYIHLPELGIDSKLRQNLSNPANRQKLFADYRHNTLTQAQNALQTIADLINEHQRVALTCFERIATDCHRHCVSDELKKQQPHWQIQHL